jgi:hypothetical protein
MTSIAAARFRPSPQNRGGGPAKDRRPLLTPVACRKFRPESAEEHCPPAESRPACCRCV